MSSENQDRNEQKKRIQPLRAWRAIKALMNDKEDTAQVFVVIDALKGNSDGRTFDRFRKTETGGRIIEERRNLIGALNDREHLRAMPEGSLGRAYLAFMEAEGLTADGLVEASEVTGKRDNVSDEMTLVRNRLRDMHDLWHVTTGYGRDGLGELSLLAFTYAQGGNRGIGAIVLYAARQFAKEVPEARIWGSIREGYRIGRKAAWLPAQDWESLLARPLSEVRAELNVGKPEIYRETRDFLAAREAAEAAEPVAANDSADMPQAAA